MNRGDWLAPGQHNPHDEGQRQDGGGFQRDADSDEDSGDQATPHVLHAQCGDERQADQADHQCFVVHTRNQMQ